VITVGALAEYPQVEIEFGEGRYCYAHVQ
jgi:hypothetical protein